MKITITIIILPSIIFQQQSSTNNPYNIDILTRRPVLSVRRRIIISPDTTTLPNHNESTASEHDSSNKHNRLRSSPKPPPLSPLLITAKHQQQSPILTSLNTSVSGNSFLSNQKNGNGKSARINVRRRFHNRRIPSTTKTLTPSATTTKPHLKPITEETGELKTTQNPLFKRRYNTGATHFPIIPTAATLNQQTYSTLTPTNATDDSVDQVAKSSIHSSFFNQLRKAAEPRKEKTKNIDATVVENVQKLGKISDDIARRIDSGPTLPTNNSFTDISREIISRTLKPKMKSRESFDRIRNKVAKSQFKTQAVPINETLDFEYYDDDSTSLLGATQNQQLKVILHGPGVIECLDQGNFPHPLSCRKFISCAKYETGGVVGWEYTCPKGTSYDPVGGMCNWAVLGCKD